MKVRDLIKKLEADGWRHLNTKGSHRQYIHPQKPGKVTVAGHPGEDIAIGSWKSVLKQAQIGEKEKE